MGKLRRRVRKVAGKLEFYLVGFLVDKSQESKRNKTGGKEKRNDRGGTKTTEKVDERADSLKDLLPPRLPSGWRIRRKG